MSAVGTVSSAGSGAYSVSFSVARSGTYKVLVLLGTAQLGSGAISLTMLPGVAAASTTTLSATSFTAIAGVESSFRMVVRDADSNIRTTGVHVAGILFFWPTAFFLLLFLMPPPLSFSQGCWPQPFRTVH